MLIYNPHNKYTYDTLGKGDIWKQLSLIYAMINVYGDQDFCDVLADSGDIFDVSLHYLPKTELFHRKKLVAVEITTTAITKSKHYHGIYKKGVSCHKSFKDLRMGISDYKQILKQGLILSKFIYIKYMPIKIGMIKLKRFKQLYVGDDEE